MRWMRACEVGPPERTAAASVRRGRVGPKSSKSTAAPLRPAVHRTGAQSAAARGVREAGRVRRPSWGAAAGAVALGLLSGAGPASAAGEPHADWGWPLAGPPRVVRTFDPPPQRWAAGPPRGRPARPGRRRRPGGRGRVGDLRRSARGPRGRRGHPWRRHPHDLRAGRRHGDAWRPGPCRRCPRPALQPPAATACRWRACTGAAVATTSTSTRCCSCAPVRPGSCRSGPQPEMAGRSTDRRTHRCRPADPHRGP